MGVVFLLCVLPVSQECFFLVRYVFPDAQCHDSIKTDPNHRIVRPVAQKGR